MRKICIGVRLTLEEKETMLQYDASDKKWTIDTTVLRHYNKAKRQGWTQLVEYVYDDGSVCGGVFEAPDYAVTIRSTTKKQMSDKQMLNLG
jgi:hypothetical protein